MLRSCTYMTAVQGDDMLAVPGSIVALHMGSKFGDVGNVRIRMVRHLPCIWLAWV